MKFLRHTAAALLFAIFIATLFAEILVPAPYARQFRESPNALPSRTHLLGTDELGRDLFSRLLYGSRVSLLLAPAAALLSTIIAALIGGVAGYVGGWLERIALAGTDLSMSLPWLFLLLTVRAVLPLNVPSTTSLLITFALLGCFGWAASARVICAGARSLRNSDFVLQAKACGCRSGRVLLQQVLPNLRPVLYAQFLISIPVFILAEANLGILGLGVSEPMPSWGGLLRGLENWSAVQANPARLAPLLLLFVVVSFFQLVIPQEGFAS
jgi:ABC-type dipeptide/oligopeptide/nickel transport system permease subunit